MNKQKAKKLLEDVFVEYREQGLLSVYLYGSITHGSGADAGDIDSVGIAEDTLPLEIEDKIRKHLTEEYGKDADFGFRILYKSEFDGGPIKGTLTKFLPPRLLLFDFPEWEYVAGEKFLQSDFKIPFPSPQEAISLELGVIKDWKWEEAEKVEEEKGPILS